MIAPTTPALPVYDWANPSRPNVFAWLAKTVERIRAERTGETRIERRTRELLARVAGDPL